LAPLQSLSFYLASSSVKLGAGIGIGVGAALQPMTTMVAAKANSKTMGRMFIGNILHDLQLRTVIAGIYWFDD